MPRPMSLCPTRWISTEAELFSAHPGGGTFCPLAEDAAPSFSVMVIEDEEALCAFTGVALNAATIKIRAHT